jgi:predicted RNA-binding protein (virulence factor B family)
LIKIGDFNNLIVTKKVDFGYYLNIDTNSSYDDILLPNKNTLASEISVGDEIEAFIYRDSSDRLVATLKKPLAKVGDLAYLNVVSNTKIGSFIDFGLEKDLLVPLKEKVYDLNEGRQYLFYIYLDKTDRLAATTNIDRYLSTESEYQVGDSVKGTVYGFQTNNSAMIAVDNLYKGVILHNQYFSELSHGEVLELNVNKLYEDGKLGLTPRNTALVERTTLQDTILEYLNAHEGFMPYNDKSAPDEIYKAFNTSKNYFKNALGGLMKRGLIVQDINGTKLK